MPAAPSGPADPGMASGETAGTGAGTAEVVLALRLGWCVAEVRGRYRDDDRPEPLGVGLPSPRVRRTDNALPLNNERSQHEQRRESAGVLRALAGSVGVDVACAHLTGQPDGTDGVAATDRLAELAKALDRAGPQERRGRWVELTDFFWAWDAVIQDRLACRDFGTSSAYQLGRGLAEIYWAFDPAAPDDDARSAAVLLGERRVRRLQDLLGRLSHHFPLYSAPAVDYALVAWAAGARDGLVDGTESTFRNLEHQNLIWRDMLLTGKDPTRYLRPSSFLDRAAQMRNVGRRFLPEITLLATGTAVLSTGAALLTTTGAAHALGAALAVLGGAGVSVSGVSAKLKDAAHNLVGQLRNELYEAAIAEATCCAPAAPAPARSVARHLQVERSGSLAPARPGTGRIPEPGSTARPEPGSTARPEPGGSARPQPPAGQAMPPAWPQQAGPQEAGPLLAPGGQPAPPPPPPFPPSSPPARVFPATSPHRPAQAGNDEPGNGEPGNDEPGDEPGEATTP